MSERMPSAPMLVENELTTSLNEEAEALIEEVENTQTARTIAERSYIYDDNDIVDVAFTQGSVSRRVSEVVHIPEIKYVIWERQSRNPNPPIESSGNYMFFDKVIELGLSKKDPEGFKNMLLLHEAGHAHDYQTKRDYYFSLVAEDKLKSTINHFLNDRDEEVTDEAILLFLQKYNVDPKVKFTDAELSELTRVAAARLLRDIDLPKEDRVMIRSQIVYERDLQIYRIKAVTERRAWLYAVRAAHSLQREGITIYDQTKKEILTFIDSMLYTYQDEANYHGASVKFVHSRRPKSEQVGEQVEDIAVSNTLPE